MSEFQNPCSFFIKVLIISTSSPMMMLIYQQRAYAKLISQHSYTRPKSNILWPIHKDNLRTRQPIIFELSNILWGRGTHLPWPRNRPTDFKPILKLHVQLATPLSGNWWLDGFLAVTWKGNSIAVLRKNWRKIEPDETAIRSEGVRIWRHRRDTRRIAVWRLFARSRC